MVECGEILRALAGLRVTSEQAFTLPLPNARSAHYYGYTGDTPPVGSQWAWARYWIRSVPLGDSFTFEDLSNDPEVRRIMCYLLGCGRCAFAAPVADDRPDAQELPPDAGYVDWGRLR